MSNSGRIAKRHAFPGLDAERGPARPLSAADVDWFVEQVVERALEPARKQRPRMLSVRSLSLAALAVVTSAAAATVVHQVHKSAAPIAPDVSTPPRQIRKPTVALALPQPRRETSAATAPSADVPAPPRAVTTSVTSPSNATNGPAPVAEPTAADELSAANDLRHKAQWQAAEAAYREVAARYQTAQEAAVAQLAAAELRLDHLGDAAGALRLYRAVPRNNALGVEALFGSSRAYRALGDRAAETAALRALLDDYPTSLQADGARARLQQLNAESTAP